MSAEQVATNWLPGLMVLGAGAAGALAYLFGSKRLQRDAPKPETAEDLDGRYQALLGELRQHQANRHLLPALDFQREKTRLELAAAQTLRTRDGTRHEETKKQARAEKRAAAEPTLASKNPALVGALVGGVAVAFFALLGWQLMQSSTDQPDGLPAPPTGPAAPGPRQPPEADPKLEALAAGVRARPNDVNAVADLSLYLLLLQAFDDARPLVQRATLLDPFHPKARVGRAVVRALDGDVPGSMDELEALAARYPEAFDARMFAGLLAMEENDSPRALEDLEAYLRLAPRSEQPPLVRMAVAQLRQQSAAAQP